MLTPGCYLMVTVPEDKIPQTHLIMTRENILLDAMNELAYPTSNDPEWFKVIARRALTAECDPTGRDEEGWIAVEDRMPEHNLGVLVFIPMEDNHITSGMWDVDNKWVLLDDYRVVGEGEGMEECEVTHWRNLPPKPSLT